MTSEGEKYFPMTIESWDDFSQNVWSGLMENTFKFCNEQILGLDADAEIKPRYLEFTEASLDYFIYEWAEPLNALKREFPAETRRFVKKMFGWAARLAGVLKCIDCFMAGTDLPRHIEIDDLKRGIKVAELYMGHNVDVALSIVSGKYIPKKSYTEQEFHLAGVLKELKAELDNGLLAIGNIYEKFNQKCPPEIILKSPRSTGSLIRSCGLTVTGGKHNANGKRAVNCLRWDKKTESFMETCLQNLQSLHKQETRAFSCADIESVKSAKSVSISDNIGQTTIISKNGNNCELTCRH